MILTLTLNTCLDRCLFVPSFALNRKIRISQTAIGMGGKPMVASWVLNVMGIPNLAMGFAAGPTGKEMKALLDGRGIASDLVWVDGDTRSHTLIICEDGSGQSTLSVDTLVVEEKHLTDLLERLQRHLGKATCLVLGGSAPRGVPVDIYQEIIHLARAHGVPVVFDASSSYLALGIQASPTIVKVNNHEIAELLARPILSFEEAYHCCRELYEKYSTQVVLTFGEQGALAYLGDRSWIIPPLAVQAINTAGAGDAADAGLAPGLIAGAIAGGRATLCLCCCNCGTVNACYR